MFHCILTVTIKKMHGGITEKKLSFFKRQDLFRYDTFFFQNVTTVPFLFIRMIYIYSKWRFLLYLSIFL